MKTNMIVVQGLNRILASEIGAINQFFLHARIFKNWGLNALNSADYEQSIRAMKDADKLIERILFLEALPNLKKPSPLRIGGKPQEMLQYDLELQQSCRADLQTIIVELEENKDYCSRELLEDVLEHCEDHIDWLEAQMDLIRTTGIQNYLQSMMDQQE